MTEYGFYNQLNLRITTKLNRKRDTQHKLKKLCIMSYDSKNCEIVKRYSINRTLLIE